jgi:hypothetical protein
MICINKSDEISWPPRQNLLCHIREVVIRGSVVSHINEGLGITCLRIHCNPESGVTSTLCVTVNHLSLHKNSVGLPEYEAGSA